MKRLFGGLKMSLASVAVFAAAAGIYTGLVMLVPMLKSTSFQDIGISYEWWVIFAVIVVVNCRRWQEAMLKCFLFFLISQPLVYAVEVVCGGLSAELAWTYYSRIWLPATVLTLPGGAIAYFCKKQNVPGAVILGLGNGIQYLMGVSYAIMAAAELPHHILSAAVSFISAVVMTLCIQKKTSLRVLALVLPAVLTAAIIVLVKMRGLYIVSGVF